MAVRIAPFVDAQMTSPRRLHLRSREDYRYSAASARHRGALLKRYDVDPLDDVGLP
jgi:hypothetical protein